MAAATLESLKILLRGSSGIPDELLGRALDFASRKVQRDGVAVSHEEFDRLQEYYAAFMLETIGAIESPLASKSVGDVGETYQTNGMSYRELYFQTLRGIVPKKGFIV